MLNHVHVLCESKDVQGFVRDFKKHTSRKLFKNLKKTEPKVADLFSKEDGKYEIWQKTNMPIVIVSENVFFQKKLYIELNPVRKN
jgi:putative transposase